MDAVTPETCRVVLQWINICILLHLLDVYSHRKNTLISEKRETLNFKNLHVLWQMLSTGSFPRILNRRYSAHTRRRGTFLLSKPPRPAMQATQPPIQSVLGVLSWGKAAGREVDRSPPSSAEAKNEWSYISTSQYVFMAQTGIGKGKSVPLQTRGA